MDKEQRIMAVKAFGKLTDEAISRYLTATGEMRSHDLKIAVDPDLELAKAGLNLDTKRVLYLMVSESDFMLSYEEIEKCVTSTVRSVDESVHMIKRGVKVYPASPHIVGLAVDFDLDVIGKSNRGLAEAIPDTNLTHTYSSIYNYRFIHFDRAPSLGAILFRPDVWKILDEDEVDLIYPYVKRMYSLPTQYYKEIKKEASR